LDSASVFDGVGDGGDAGSIRLDMPPSPRRRLQDKVGKGVIIIIIIIIFTTIIIIIIITTIIIIIIIITPTMATICIFSHSFQSSYGGGTLYASD
jgi:hypothetical protein